jgi:hypothetical protein
MDRNPPDKNLSVEHEPSDVSVRSILGFGLGFSVLLVVVVVLMGWIHHLYFREPASPRGSPLIREKRPVSAVSSAPQDVMDDRMSEVLEDLRRREHQALTTYGWVDRRAGVVRIPVDRAMDLLVERGLPTRPKKEKP